MSLLHKQQSKDSSLRKWDSAVATVRFAILLRYETECLVWDCRHCHLTEDLVGPWGSWVARFLYLLWTFTNILLCQTDKNDKRLVQTSESNTRPYSPCLFALSTFLSIAVKWSQIFQFCKIAKVCIIKKTTKQKYIPHTQSNMLNLIWKHLRLFQMYRHSDMKVRFNIDFDELLHEVYKELPWLPMYFMGSQWLSLINLFWNF